LNALSDKKEKEKEKENYMWFLSFHINSGDYDKDQPPT
jgi:hypothetical protein